MGWKVYDEALEMLELRCQYLPHCVRWKGRRLWVETIVASWVRKQSWHRRGARRFFQVRCAEGDLELYQDLRTGAWFLRRARFLGLNEGTTGYMWPTWSHMLTQEGEPGGNWTALV